MLKIKSIYFILKNNSVLLTNYLIIGYAFFLPLSKSISNIFFTLVIVCFFLNGNIKDKIRFSLKDKVVVSILAFVLMHIVWLMGTEHFEYAEAKISNMKHFLTVIIIISMVSKEYITKIITAFVLSMLFSEICSYLIFFNFIEPFNNATINNPVPFMLNHSLYSTFLALALGILLFNLFKKELKLSYFKRFVAIFFSITIIFNILIISSRLGYVLLFVVMFSMPIVFFRKYIFRTIFVVGFLLVIIYTVAYNNISNFETRANQAISNIEKIFTQEDYTTSEGIRFGFYEYSLEILKDNPIFGVGTGDHINYVKDKIIDYKHPEPMLYILNGGENANLHSDYFDILVQFGVIGLIVFLNIFYQILNYNQKNQYLKFIQILLVIVVLVQSIPQGVVYLSPVNKLFILLLAITLNLYQSKNDELKVGSN